MAVCSIYVKVFGFILASYWSHIKIQFRVMKTVVKINKAKNLFSGLNTSAKYSKYVDLGAFCIQRKGLRKKKIEENKQNTSPGGNILSKDSLWALAFVGAFVLVCFLQDFLVF